MERHARQEDSGQSQEPIMLMLGLAGVRRSSGTREGKLSSILVMRA